MTGVVPFATDAASVAVGAVLGALARYQIGRVATEKIASDPQRLGHLAGWHTAGINILGSFTLGGVFGSPVVDYNKAPSSSTSTSSSSIIGKKPLLPPTLSGSGLQASKLRRFTSAPRNAANKMASAISPSKFHGLTPRMKLMLGVGFCGSFTTFSTFSVDVVNMMHKGETTKAVSYMMANNVGGVCAAAAGMMIARRIFCK